MANFYCEYCGYKSTNASSLTGQACQKHPLGNNKGKHSLYQGSEKPKYTCKFCGYSSASILLLTSNMCQRHPNGNNKGHHAPAL